jgi:hypothetical protein
MKNALCPATALHGSFAVPFVNPTEAKRRDLQFRGPFVEMFFDRAQPDFLPRGAGHGHVCGFR